jgi:hypothetical protein
VEKVRMTTLILSVSDITLFLNPSKSRALNAEHNKIRENVLALLPHIPVNFFEHPEHGAHWSNFQAKGLTALGSITNVSHNKMEIKHMGGMSNNHDYLIRYFDNDVEVDQKKVEFKHNNCDIAKLPQFLEIYDKDFTQKFSICDQSYTKFYYDNYLGQYLGLIDEFIDKPDFDTYQKNVHDIKYTNQFFDQLYKHKETNTKEKRKIANESITEFLKMYSPTFNFDKITEKIQDSQRDKTFLLWDKAEFHTKQVDINNIKIRGITGIKGAYIDLDVTGFEYNLRVRLNWGNNLGLANPRWKFSFISK